ncbi:TPA: acyl CoA:acetate/3-ketoacid CoA transferase [Klebsiella oxytoca]|nr:acyl CoA:acetate/3-ketoacid CoA transferase [Klebsiella oxytoca]
MNKVTSADAVAALIEDGATIAISGNGGGMVEADYLLAAIEKRFLETGHPRDLTLIHSLGIGDRDSKGSNRFAHAGMLKRIIAGHFTWSPKMQALVKNEEIEAYCFPGGVIQALLREIGSGRPGLITHVGLGSFVDPRHGGGKSNARTTEDMVELIEIDGETKLRYRPFRVNYAIVRGTYADPRGNVSLEEEAINMDSYSMALAAHNSGGKVFVQVRDVLEAGAIAPRNVTLPGILVDGIVEHREQPQTYLGGYDLTISGQHRRLCSSDAIELVSHPVRRLIARRAARELVAGASTNFGFGIPGGIPGIALREGVPYQSLWLSVEQGVHNGMMLDDALFGCARNADAIIPSLDQFEFYSGGGIDITFLGMGEMDRHGNVNVSHLNGNLIGPGGFLEIAQNARKVVFCGTFDAKGSKINVTPNGLQIEQSGEIPKLVTEVEKITFSASYARQSGQEVLYVTERAVFQLTEAGVELIEIAPGVNVERDILPYMAFRPIINQPRLMDSALFSAMEDA